MWTNGDIYIYNLGEELGSKSNLSRSDCLLLTFLSSPEPSPPSTRKERSTLSASAYSTNSKTFGFLDWSLTRFQEFNVPQVFAIAR
ncbi:uncharacterized protein OCT59_008562 [Rhizophagus irregularis]|uniref:uncharacterized protein n=1 Tax=Rhizophagus irregularis TaxID=588596 RepID=UPI0019E24BC7|nr:hypothetical protein OCT59_008562 [Rhizophagus irregularis]GET60706.1 hypothetical protein RIR_jg2420.t1 [Rhizophagus irregularis DAOM 181602=DAOM 197198]